MQALAEQEGIEQHRARLGLRCGEAEAAIELLHCFQALGIHLAHGRCRHGVGARPLPDRQLDRHALGVGALAVALDEAVQALGRRVAQLDVARQRLEAAVAPGREDRLEQRAAVLVAAIEAALGDAQPRRQHLDAHAIDAAARQLGQPGRHPVL